MSRTISMKYALDWTTVGIYLFLVFLAGLIFTGQVMT